MSQNKEDERCTLREDFSADIDCEDLGFGSSVSHQVDENELSSGEGTFSTQICSSLTGSSGSLSELGLENGDCCVQDIRWQVSDVVWPSPPSEEKYFKEECFRFQSTCEHHLLPFAGHIYIGFIPRQGRRSVDSRKLEQIVSTFCLRLQLQERITHQIAEAIQQMVDPIGLVIVARANHMCMVGRGVQSHSSSTVNSVIHGENTSFLLQKAAVALGDISSIKRSTRCSFWDPWQLEAKLRSVLGWYLVSFHLSAVFLLYCSYCFISSSLIYWIFHCYNPTAVQHSCAGVTMCMVWRRPWFFLQATTLHVPYVILWCPTGYGLTSMINKTTLTPTPHHSRPSLAFCKPGVQCKGRWSGLQAR